MQLPDPLVVVYLAAVATGNLLVSRYGPSITILNAFLFIGLDLSSRDHLHERWQGRLLLLRMLLLIGVGGLLSLLLGGSGRVAVASCLAFILAGSTDTIAYRALDRSPWAWRANGSNLVGAAVDSLCFPLFAFGPPLLWSVALAQFVAKVAGGAIWILFLQAPRSHRSAQHASKNRHL